MTPRSHSSQRSKHYALLGGLLLLALGVRLWRLTYHSLWFDETMSVFWANQPAARIWEVGMHLVEDRHPPLYYLMLRGWTILFGSSDAVVRSLGAMLGALAVLPAFGIGRLLGDRRAGALAALLVALNPFLVWYSQEARMFVPAATLGLFALYGLLRGWQSCSVRFESLPSNWDADDRRGACLARVWGVIWWGIVLVGLVMCVYSYLFGVFLLVVAGLWLVALLLLTLRVQERGRHWSAFLVGAIVLTLAGGLMLPLLWAGWQVSGTEFTEGRMFDGMGGVLLRQLTAYTLHQGPWSDGVVRAAQVGAGLLALAGLALPLRSRPGSGELRSAGRPLLALYLVGPLLLGGLLLARNRVLFDKPHYFTFLAPALCLLWGRGLAALLDRARLLGLLALVGLLAAMVTGLSHLWLPQNLREDWRTAAAYVEAHAGPNDAVLTHVDYVHFSFEYYFRGSQPVFFPFTDRVTDIAQVEPPLLGLLPFDSVWLVQSHTEQFDPDHLVERWLADRFPLATEQYPAGMTVKRFITRYRLPEPPADASKINAAFGPDITLVACAVDDTRTLATDERTHPPSGWVHVRLYWRAEARPPADYAATVRMVDHLGQVWGDRLHCDRGTLRLWPTSRWETEEVIRQEVDVNLNPITPLGEYRIVVGLVDDAGQPLGAEVICGQVQVVN